MEIETCKNCHTTTNSKYIENCPPLMQDGRQFTQYVPNSCVLNYTNLNSYDYRQDLIRNAKKYMKQNLDNVIKNNVCNTCDNDTMLDHKTMLKCDKEKCEVGLYNKNGLGQGRLYNTNKCSSSGDTNNKISNTAPPSCCFTKKDDFKFYPMNMNVTDNYGRYSSPSGGIPLAATSRNPFVN